MSHEVKAFLLALENYQFPNSRYDFGFLQETFVKNNIEIMRVRNIPPMKKAFIVIIGSDFAGKENLLSAKIKNIEKVVLFLISDEFNLFDVEKLKHKDIKVWKNYLKKDTKNVFPMPLGTPMRQKLFIPELSAKKQDIFFAGQVTSHRREELISAMQSVGMGNYISTKAFMQGEHKKIYNQKMMEARIAPAPSGHPNQDSFRVYEALEMLTMPIGDIRDTSGKDFDVWNFIFQKEPPFPRTNNWSNLYDIVQNIKDEYPKNMHDAVLWWIEYKINFGNKILFQLEIDQPKTFVINLELDNNQITTGTVDSLVNKIEKEKMFCDIAIQISGLLNKKEKDEVAYQDFINTLLWNCVNVYQKTLPIFFYDNKTKKDMENEAKKRFSNKDITFV